MTEQRPKAFGTELVALYDLLGVMREQERLAMARWLAGRPDVMAEMFRHSVRVFSGNRIAADKTFNEQGRAPGRGKGGRSYTGPGITSGRQLQILMAEDGRTWSVATADGSVEDFTYVAFEVRPRHGGPTSTKAGARVISADLLLRAHDGVPIVAEAKVEADKDPFYALVQALAAAAQLVTESQRARLRARWDGDLDRGFDQLEVWLLIVPRTSAGEHHGALLEQARLLAAGLNAYPAMKPFVRRIALVDVTRTNAGLAFAMQPLGSPPDAEG